MNTLKPCSYCGNTSFHYFPNMSVQSSHTTQVLGFQAQVHGAGERWNFTLVACTHCGNSLVFTTNAQQIAQRTPGAQVIQAGQG